MSSKLIILVIAECAALPVIAQLWWRRKGRFWRRVVWTVVLLIPIAGVILYAITRNDPEGHPLDPPESTGTYDPGP